jgi:hypothetical protein
MEKQPTMLSLHEKTGSNRANARLAENEYSRLKPELSNIEECFLRDIFNPQCEASYRDTYLFYLDIWHTTVRKLKHGRKYILWTINENYFNQMYFPVVSTTERSYRFFSLFNQISAWITSK